MTLKKILIFMGCFSVESLGMIGIPNDDFNGQPSRLVQQLVNLDGYDSDTDSENEQSELSETLINSHEVSFLDRTEIEDVSESETEVPPYGEEEENLSSRKKEKLDIKGLISNGNIFKTKVEKNFYKLLSREVNTDFILDMVWNEGFDTSFQIEKTDLNGVCKGIGADKNPVFFAENNIERFIDVPHERGLLYSEGNMDEGIEVNLIDTVLLGIQPAELKTEDINEIQNYIKEIMMDSVGLRQVLVFLVKCLANENKKIKLVKTQNESLGFEYIPGKKLWEYEELDGIDRNALNKKSPKHKFFVFSSNWLKNKDKHLFMRLNPENQEEMNTNKFSVTWEPAHKEIMVLKAMIHSQHPNIKNDIKRAKNIEKIIRKGRWQVHLPAESLWLPINTDSVSRFIFSNDEILRTILGIHSRGLDLTNLASYSVHKYGGIEFMNINDKTEYSIMRRRNRNQSTPIKVKLDKDNIRFIFMLFSNSKGVVNRIIEYYLSNEFMEDFDNVLPCSETQSSLNSEIKDFDNVLPSSDIQPSFIPKIKDFDNVLPNSNQKKGFLKIFIKNLFRIID